VSRYHPNYPNGHLSCSVTGAPVPVIPSRLEVACSLLTGTFTNLPSLQTARNCFFSALLLQYPFYFNINVKKVNTFTKLYRTLLRIRCGKFRYAIWTIANQRLAAFSSKIFSAFLGLSRCRSAIAIRLINSSFFGYSFGFTAGKKACHSSGSPTLLA